LYLRRTARPLLQAVELLPIPGRPQAVQGGVTQALHWVSLVSSLARRLIQEPQLILSRQRMRLGATSRPRSLPALVPQVLPPVIPTTCRQRATIPTPVARPTRVLHPIMRSVLLR